MTDVVIPFGDDIVIISDKANRYDIVGDGEHAWARWYRKAIRKSLKQLSGAMKTVENAPEKVFMDARLTEKTPRDLNPEGERRIHLVGIARPDHDPQVVPAGWQKITYTSRTTERPFEIGPLEVRGRIVHLFDGPTINLLLERLDTAPDFIAYLKGREAALLEGQDYEFIEEDLLGASLIGWEFDPLGLPSVPPLETIGPGIWDMYEEGEHSRQRRAKDEPSWVLDRFINQEYDEFIAGRFLNKAPSSDELELAMRLLASEGRFARRVIAYELYDLLKEKDQTTTWSSTIPSPTNASLRYVWVTYPPRPSDVTQAEYDAKCLDLLQQHLTVALGLFDQELVFGICLPNPTVEDTARFTCLGSKADWTIEKQNWAMHLHAQGIFAGMQPVHRKHFR